MRTQETLHPQLNKVVDYEAIWVEKNYTLFCHAVKVHWHQSMPGLVHICSTLFDGIFVDLEQFFLFISGFTFNVSCFKVHIWILETKTVFSNVIFVQIGRGHLYVKKVDIVFSFLFNWFCLALNKIHKRRQNFFRRDTSRNRHVWNIDSVWKKIEGQ